MHRLSLNTVHRSVFTFYCSLLTLFLLSACASTSKRVVLLADGERRVVETQAVTVEDFMREQQIVLGDSDRLEPPLYAEVPRSAAITVTRVQLKTETVQQPLPFTRRLVKDEAFPDGQTRVVQLGANGIAQVTLTIILENGEETARRESSRQVILQPKDEILAIGTQGGLPNVPLSGGTVVYIANGNAWVMRNNSRDKRPLTTTNDLDGRVFAISADARHLLFSRAVNDGASNFNSLWIMDTLVLGELPRALPVSDVIAAQISPDARAIAYSTGMKLAGAPGWKAKNDLVLAALPSDLASTQNIALTRQQIWKPNIPGMFGWWGGALAWSPDGRALAYAFPSEIGYTDLPARITSGENIAPRKVLKKFAPFATLADWVWIPPVAWSPDSRFVVSVAHAPNANPNVASEDAAFEVWAFSRDGAVSAPLAKQTGMWASPQWSPPDDKRDSRIAFGIAQSPSDSERSHYTLNVMDRDGGNKKQIFPTAANETGLIVAQTAWSPNAKQLIVVREGDLWLYDFPSGRWSQLTANGASALPRWGK